MEKAKNYIIKLHQKYGREPYPNNSFYWLKFYRYCKRYHPDWLETDYTKLPREPDFFDIFLKTTFFKIGELSKAERWAYYDFYGKLYDLELETNRRIFGDKMRTLCAPCITCKNECSIEMRNFFADKLRCDCHTSPEMHHINMDEWLFDYLGNIVSYGNDLSAKSRYGGKK